MMKASDMQIKQDLKETVNKVFLDLFDIAKLKSINYEEAQATDVASFRRFKELCEEFNFPNNKKMYVDSKNRIIKKTLSDYFTRVEQYNVDELYDELFTKITKEKKEAREAQNQDKTKIIQFISDKTLDSYTSHKELTSHGSKIKKMLKAEFLKKGEQVEIIIKDNDNKGANPGYIATVKTETGREEKYYVKTFSDDPSFKSKGLINPNELLIYKIIQYINLGPETLFLIKGGSSSGSNSGSIHAGNYIATKDLNEENHKFLLDTPENEELISDLAKNYTKQFAVEIEFAAAMRDILSLYDTFNKNVKNYGLLVSNNEESIKIQFIDHLPNANNGILSKLLSKSPEEIKKYSPRLHLDEEYMAIRKDNQNFNKSPIIDYAIKTREEYSKDAIREEVKTRLLLSNIIDLIKQASEDVKTLIGAYEENFTPDALSSLDSYVEKINQNLKTFYVSMNYTDLDHNIPNVYAFHDQEGTSFIPSSQEEMKEYESKFIGEAQDH